MSEEQQTPQPDPSAALRDMVIGKGSEQDIAILPMFLGTAEDVHKTIYKTAIAYMAWRSAEEEAQKELGSVTPMR